MSNLLKNEHTSISNISTSTNINVYNIYIQNNVIINNNLKKTYPILDIKKQIVNATIDNMTLSENITVYKIVIDGKNKLIYSCPCNQYDNLKKSNLIRHWGSHSKCNFIVKKRKENSTANTQLILYKDQSYDNPRLIYNHILSPSIDEYCIYDSVLINYKLPEERVVNGALDNIGYILSNHNKNDLSLIYSKLLPFNEKKYPKDIRLSKINEILNSDIYITLMNGNYYKTSIGKISIYLCIAMCVKLHIMGNKSPLLSSFTSNTDYLAYHLKDYIIKYNDKRKYTIYTMPFYSLSYKEQHKMIQDEYINIESMISDKGVSITYEINKLSINIKKGLHNENIEDYYINKIEQHINYINDPEQINKYISERFDNEDHDIYLEDSSIYINVTELRKCVFELLDIIYKCKYNEDPPPLSEYYYGSFIIKDDI